MTIKEPGKEPRAKVQCAITEVDGLPAVVLTFSNLKDDFEVAIISGWLRDCVRERFPGAMEKDYRQ